MLRPFHATIRRDKYCFLLELAKVSCFSLQLGQCQGLLPASDSGALSEKRQPRLLQPHPNLFSPYIYTAGQILGMRSDNSIGITIDRSHDNRGYLKHNAIIYTFICQSLPISNPASYTPSALALSMASLYFASDSSLLFFKSTIGLG